ncbi:MAG: hypothetical protein CBC23_001715 [Rhodospirillaceae bacterium TMED63]|nr:hypothetical protein [Rhodospirillaceae bacterium]RPG03870.1 MAG: hypothetical protein CBC23_001715 [Rhodospirillaceae bacterium TMED63]
MPSTHIEQASFLGRMERNALEIPDKVAIHSLNQDKQIRHGDLFQVANRIGRYFEARDIGPNERVALLSNNSLEHLAARDRQPYPADTRRRGCRHRQRAGRYSRQAGLRRHQPRESRWISPDAGLERCGRLLTDFKMPHEVISRNALPKTERCKMDRNARSDLWKAEHATA